MGCDTGEEGADGREDDTGGPEDDGATGTTAIGAPHLPQNFTSPTGDPHCLQKAMSLPSSAVRDVACEVLPAALKELRGSNYVCRPIAAVHNRPAIFRAMFSAASALTPDSRKSIFTMTSPLRIMSAEFPGAM